MRVDFGAPFSKQMRTADVVAKNEAEEILIDILDLCGVDTSLILEHIKSNDLMVIKKSQFPEVMIQQHYQKPTTCQVKIDNVLRFDGVDKSVLL